ncbi:MAG: amidohydrolase [Thermostichus sp. BF3_bins_97]
MVDFTLQQAWIPSADGYEIGDLHITGGCISAMGPNLPAEGILVDAHHKLLLPGFVNGHTHSPQIWLRGLVSPLPLELWLSETYGELPAGMEAIYWSAAATALETLLSGGTTVMDHISLIPGQELPMIEAAVRAYRDMGIRAFVAPLIRDESMQAGIPSGGKLTFLSDTRSTEGLLELMQEVIDRFHRPEDGIHIAVGPSGPQLCSDALFLGCMELSDRYGLARHSHLLETKAQQILCQEKYGCGGAEHLYRLGYFNERTSLAHCVWLSDAEIPLLAETGATVVHNPLSNLRLGSGIAPILKYRQAGVNVALGCDGAASSDGQDLLEAIKLGSILHCVTDPDYRHWMTPRQSLEMAALGGARGLGLEAETGSIAVGKSADLALYDLTQLSLLPRTDPIGLLVLGRPTQVVESVWVRGKRLIEAGQFCPPQGSPHLTQETLRQQLLRRGTWRKKSLSAATQALETRYRAAMGLSP